MSVAVAITGHGSPVILLHGLGASHRVWHAVVDQLAPRRQLFAFDLPGCGSSAADGRAPDPSRIAHLIEQATARLGVERFSVIGHSLGAVIAVHMARQAPSRVERVLLVSPVGLSPKPSLRFLAGRAYPVLVTARRSIGLRTAHRPLARRALLGRVVFDPARFDPDDARIVLSASRSAAMLGAGAALATSIDTRPLLSELAMPVTIIWGRHDRVCALPHPAALALMSPRLRLRVVEQCGHLPILEHPRLVARLIEDALVG